MEIIIEQNAAAASHAAAHLVSRLLREKPNSVLGLATGNTPLLLYREMIRMHREEGLDFSGVTTFNLDEYIGLEPTHPQSYHAFMEEHLFSQININPDNVHIPDGSASDVLACCAAYEQAIVDAGGIDLQLLGLGGNGHIGFNEPTSSFASRTRIKALSRQTIRDNARFFGEDESLVPRLCITVGMGTIMDARVIVLLAFGRRKAAAVAAMVEGPVSAMTPASILQHHPVARIFIDEAAAAGLKHTDYYRWIYDAKRSLSPDLQA